PRLGLDAASIKKQYENHLRYDLGVDKHTATNHDRYYALAWAVRDRLVDRWIKTQGEFYEQHAKRVYYLSMEFLIGRSLGNNVMNLLSEDAVAQAMEELGFDWDELREEETDPGLGNGGLGRLAACFLESMATLGLPAYGYTLRYEHGIFQQAIEDGHQVEHPDSWLRGGNPWEIARPGFAVKVRFGGRSGVRRENGRLVGFWEPDETILGIPYDMPVIGHGGHTVDTLRLWRAAAPDDFDLEDFNNGDYIGAVNHKVLAENLTMVLYPNDNTAMGRELRFRQQYFLVTCSIDDILRRFWKNNDDILQLPNQAAIQLNDTHPTLAIPELMRILLDQHGMQWDPAWNIVTQCMAYTNHTLLSEALECWPVDMVQRLLPRHFDIICEINQRFLAKAAAFFPGDAARRERMSIIQESPQRNVRMANLAIIGSHSVNGVAALHTELLKSQLVPDFADMWPERFNNKTNGVTPRRWLRKANPPLSSLISSAIGDGWTSNLDELVKLKSMAEDSAFQEAFRKTKRQAKDALAERVWRCHRLRINPEMRFDVQCKRIHTYKRQLLNALHIANLYQRLREGTLEDFSPTAFLFAGKAAPGFLLAKSIVKFINNLASIVNNDPKVNERLNVHFLPNYRVSLAERLIPAADVSEQVSLAGTEASGTGNMKFMMNGALTLGTMDGANIEIVEEVGRENAFIFGMTSQEVQDRRGSYDPWWHYNNDENIRRTIDMAFHDNVFSADEPGLFEDIRRFLFDEGDLYMHFADFQSYADAHAEVQILYDDEEEWTRRAVLNIAASGKFSSDRTVQQYAKEIWDLKPCLIPSLAD
ncbi:MAG: glycogen/starch/alpha-glucan phosphorylase, partial [Lentisphaeria bacterium]|nr:glycogen/starch/alpha-glucan phosphorylase [Lentisphaeria bacterium]